MQDFVRFSGGAIIGRLRISLPTTLLANSQGITLDFFLGKYIFYSDVITSIEVKGTSKIAIHHTMHQYPERIIFISSNSERKARQIRRLLPHLYTQKNPAISSPRKGWPVRWQFVSFSLAWWNSPFLIASQYPEINETFPLSVITSILTFVGTLLVMRFPSLQYFVVTPGRHIGEVKHVIILVSFLTGIISLSMVIGFIAQVIQQS
ncbi:MAG: hypothetical protein F6J95_026410 [Leptolyngbya sp. SIO1E4]|nr:hypothetical protein [Leptolyngbya sp. SIO1E4]